ncbi:hypothetical protein JCM10908_000336 [Rhodotorula pacifica]|uniref:uncharacterized protein n=1 Tax=Rhodotorula pacifica TaxID=1495444 RepID=UPI003179466A
MAPHPGSTTLSSSTTSTSLEPFPLLTSKQHRRIEATLAHLPQGARTWADLTLAQEQLASSQRRRRGGGGGTDEDDDQDDDDMYEIWLKLVWQDGVTWKDKWDNVKRQLDQAALGAGAGNELHAGASSRHHHRRRLSDNLDLLRQKLDRVTLATTTRGGGTTTGSAPGPPTAAAAQPRRPHSTPPRPLLVQPPPPLLPSGPSSSYPDLLVSAEHYQHHSSSDEQFVSVPTTRPNKKGDGRGGRLALPPRAERRAFVATTTDDDGDRVSGDEGLSYGRKTAATSRRKRTSRSGPLPETPTVAMSTPARPSHHHGATLAPPVAPEPDPTPLLSARLSTLPRRPSLSSTSSASMLISSSLSAPEALSRAIQFSRLRLLLPLFSHWQYRTRFLLDRETDLDRKRGGWLARCAIEQWRVAVRTLRERDEERIKEARRFEGEKVRSEVLRRWRNAVKDRERRKKIEGLTQARDQLLSRVDRRLITQSLSHWRHQTASRLVSRQRRTNLARAALYTWQRRLRSLREREDALSGLAQGQRDRWEFGRAKERWRWWIRRTAIRVKEAEYRAERDEQGRNEVWETWRAKTLERDRLRRLEALATYSDSRRLATESLSHWIAQLLHQRRQASLAQSQHDLLTRHRATGMVKQWRLALRVGLSTRVRGNELMEGALERWMERLEVVKVEMAQKAVAFRAERDSTLANVSLSSWRASTSRVRRLDNAAQGVHRTRLLVKTLTRWRAKTEREKVQRRRADVVRDFMVLRGAWRRWSEREWERRRSAWEAAKRKERVREAWQFWRDQTQRKRLERELVTRFRRKQDRRLAAVTLNVWLENVISHKEREREAVQWSDARVLRSGFAGWADATVRADERLVLADAHRAVKLEELRERLFRQWRETAQRSRLLRERCDAVLTRRGSLRLEGAWDKWRERSLRRSEEQVALRRKTREREEAWEWWKARTKTLAAVEFHKVQLGSRALACWRAWTPPRELSLQAVETDSRAITSGALQVWRIKANAKFALRSLSGRLRMGNSPSSASPPQRISNAQTPPLADHLYTPEDLPAPTTEREKGVRRAQADPSSPPSWTEARLPPSVTCSTASNDMPGSMYAKKGHGQADPAATADKETVKYQMVRVREADSGRSVQLVFIETNCVGEGSFGVVNRAELYSDNEQETGVVALKRTRQDKRFKCREMQIISAVLHPNIVKLRYYWYEADDGSDDLYLNLMFEYLPETLYRLYRSYVKRRQWFPDILIKLYVYQLLRGLNYLHARGICHRDIKPQNLLVDPDTGRLVIIDFGSAKVLKPDEPNVSYTASRYYRAPELIFGSTEYDLAIDLWSVGCILAELINGEVLFPGTSGLDQIVAIIKILGTPTREQIRAMNKCYHETSFPKFEPVNLKKILPRASPEHLSLLSSLLRYEPEKRLTAIEALSHNVFDDLRRGNGSTRDGAWQLRLPGGKQVKVDLFDFTDFELSIRQDLNSRLVPPHARAQLFEESGVDLDSFEPINISRYRLDID